MESESAKLLWRFGVREEQGLAAKDREIPCTTGKLVEVSSRPPPARLRPDPPRAMFQ